MVDFVHPFPGKNPGDPLTKTEIIRALRLSLCAEEEATQLYNSIAEYVDDPKIKKIMEDVADEEQVHIGEFQKLLNIYEEDEVEKLEEGFEEAEEKMKESNELKKLADNLQFFHKHARELDHVQQFLESVKASGGDIDFALKQIAMLKAGEMADLHDCAIHLIDLKSSVESNDELADFFDPGI